jgi:hypothetical protein
VTSVTGFLDGLANHGRLVVRSLMMSLKDVVRASRKGDRSEKRKKGEYRKTSAGGEASPFDTLEMQH